ncbi:MAG TPA: phosphate ABC transporter permease subunit PstC [Yinghuangia sp.]|uniref:phosphate ABC transporter permease subunit PstC n=1 Tax=Yinghuangia sp. YIM S10712 TaxID=3436930 RepID=UPI002C08AFF3|nr:phosphate ABC transporter permease subunit PstC [Yinghuangia sp.]
MPTSTTPESRDDAERDSGRRRGKSGKRTHGADARPPGQKSTVRLGDRLFAGSSRGAGILLLVIMAAIAVFLITEALDALGENDGNFLTDSTWVTDGSEPAFGVAGLVTGTVISAALAMLLAVPVAVGVALFITHYAPRRVAQTLGYIVDLLAAVPSVVFGLWGLVFLSPKLTGLHAWLGDYLGFIPIFDKDDTGATARTLFTCGIILAIMILPIIAAVTREVFLQVPRAHEEAALALGATRWEMIRTAVLPFGKPGIISASMLGLGRALGETIAVAMVLSSSQELVYQILDVGGNTIAANIANQFGESNELGRGALIASGLVLFFLTLLVNGAARVVINRHKEFSGANA